MRRRLLVRSALLWAVATGLMAGSLDMWRRTDGLRAACVAGHLASSHGCARATGLFPASICVVVVLGVAAQLRLVRVEGRQHGPISVSAACVWGWGVVALAVLGIAQVAALLDASDVNQYATCSAQNPVFNLCISIDAGTIGRVADVAIVVAAVLCQAVVVVVIIVRRRRQQHVADTVSNPEPVVATPGSLVAPTTVLATMVAAMVALGVALAVTLPVSTDASTSGERQPPSAQTSLVISSTRLLDASGRAHLLDRLRAFDGVVSCAYTGVASFGTPPMRHDTYACTTRTGGPDDGWAWRMDLDVREWPDFDVGIS